MSAVLYQEAHYHWCPFAGHRELVACSSGPNCTIPFKVACPECISKLMIGRANNRVRSHGYGAQL